MGHPVNITQAGIKELFSAYRPMNDASPWLPYEREPFFVSLPILCESSRA